MKKKTTQKKALSLFLVTMLIAATVLLGGCSDNNTLTTPETTLTSETEKASVTELGEGKLSFNFSVTYENGETDSFLIKTDEKTVGDALLKLELIDGEAGDYGLYVKSVNGVTADYDATKTYWAFYVNGEYASSGVDQTEIDENAQYSFKIEK